MTPTSLAETRVLLLVGGPLYHNTADHQRILSEFIGAKCKMVMHEDMDVMSDEGLEPFDVIVNYTTFYEPTVPQSTALINAVFNGKGFVGIHGATATYWNSPEYLRMIGGTFIVHDKFKLFKVKFGSERCVEAHPITAGIEDFDIEDELYIVEGDQTQWHIIARAEGHAILYNKTHGNGRVHYNALGHDGYSLNHPSFQQLVLNAIEWAALLR